MELTTTTTNNTESNTIQQEIKAKNEESTCTKKHKSILIALVLGIILIGSITAIIIIFNPKWSTIAAIIYFSSYFALLVVLALYIHVTEQHDNKKSFLKSLWCKRGIYGQIFVHLYDTATDLGVLIEWYLLMEKEKSGERDVESLNMEALFWTTISFLILYRVTSCCFAYCSTFFGSDGDKAASLALFDGFCLGLLDLYIIKVVYNAIKNDEDEPSPRQKMFQLFESIFESLPQVVLQSVFIIRGYNDQQLRDDNTLVLVGTSLFASLFSIANKYTWVDKDAVVGDAKEPEFHKRCPCVNPKYVLRVIWRFSYVLTRFCVISLIWSVLGGAFVGIFLGISFILWWGALSAYFIFSDTTENSEENMYAIMLSGMYGIVTLVASPAVRSIGIAVVHMVEMIVSISVITLFAFTSYDCGICADPIHRQADSNPFILMFLIAAWASMVIDFVTYSLMFCLEIIEDDDRVAFALFGMVVGGVEM